jgi:3-methyl-2-oxobutanoate hydroxymethyltransferase
MAETVTYLVRRGIPVMGHVGLTPQSINRLKGYRARGRDPEEAAAITADAASIAHAGAFAIVLEGVIETLAREITARIPTPIVGIGASAACDGQVLVSEDMTGLFSAFKPKFVKRYAELGPEIDKAAAAYAAEVRSRRFPGAEHCFAPVAQQR